jgi:hypothetical protein
MDPVAAAYAAGRAAGRRGVNGWRCIAVVAVAVTLVGSLAHVAPNGAKPAAAGTTAVVGLPPRFRSVVRPAELVRVEQALLDHGLDGLPPAPRRAVFPDRLPLF